MDEIGDLNKPWSGRIYDLQVRVEIYNLRKDHAKVVSKDPRKKYVDVPTDQGTTWLIARTKDKETLNSVPLYLHRAARRIRSKLKGNELIIITKVDENEFSNVRRTDNLCVGGSCDEVQPPDT